MASPYSVWHIQLAGEDSSTRVVADPPCLNVDNVWEFRNNNRVVAWFPRATVLYIKLIDN